MQFDFTYDTFEDNSFAMYFSVNEETAYDNLFKMSSSDVGFIFASTQVKAEQAESGTVERGDGSKADDDTDDDSREEEDEIITWIIVLSFLGLVLISVCIYCCCLTCTKRKARKAEEEERRRLAAQSGV